MNIITRQSFFLSLGIVFFVLSLLTILNVIENFPNILIVIGTSTILIMNFINPLIEWLLKRNPSSKNESIDYKGTSFIFGVVASIIISSIFYYFFNDHDWLIQLIDKEIVWGLNASILLINLAIIEIKNNSKIRKQEHIKKIELIEELIQDKKIIKELRNGKD